MTSPTYADTHVGGEVNEEQTKGRDGKLDMDEEKELTPTLRMTRTVSQHFRALSSHSNMSINSSSYDRSSRKDSSSSSSKDSSSSSSSKDSSNTNSNPPNSNSSSNANDHNSSDRCSNSSSADSLSFLLPEPVVSEASHPTGAPAQEEKARTDVLWTAAPRHGAGASRLSSNNSSSNGSSSGSSSSSSQDTLARDGNRQHAGRAASRSRGGRGSQSSSPPRAAAGAAAKGPASTDEKKRTVTAAEEGRLFGRHLRVLCLNCYLIPPSISWNPHLWAAFWSCKRAHQRAAEIGQVAAQYDLVCLQEVWGTNMPALTAAVLPTHSILPETQAWGGVDAAAAAPAVPAAAGSYLTSEESPVRRLSSAGSSSASSPPSSPVRARQTTVAVRGGNAAWRCATAAAAMLRWWGSELLDPCRFYCSRTGGLFYAWRRQKCAFLRLERQPFPRHAQVPFSNQNVTAVELDVGNVFPPQCRLLLLNTHFSVLSKEARDSSRQVLQRFLKTLAWKSYLRFLARQLQGAEEDQHEHREAGEDTSDEDSSVGGSSSSSTTSESESSTASDSESEDSSTSGEGGSSSSSSGESERRARRRRRGRGRHRRSGGDEKGTKERARRRTAPSFLKNVAVLLCGDFNIDAEKAPSAYQKLKTLDGAASMRDLFLPQHNPNYPYQYTYFTQESGTTAAGSGARSRQRSRSEKKAGAARKVSAGNTLFPWPTQGRIDYIFAVDDVFLSAADVQQLAQECPPDVVVGEDYEDMEIPVLKDGSVRIFFERIYCLGMDIVAQKPGTELSDHWPLSARITIGKPPSHELLQQLPKPRREQLLRGYSFCCSTAYNGSRRSASAASRPAAAAAKRKSSKSKDVDAADVAHRQQSSRGRQQQEQKQ